MNFSSFFGSSERSKGADLLRKNLVVISSASDTDVRAFVKSSSSCRVSLTAEEVEAPSFTSNCSCPLARKGELCKHIWAVLLKLEENKADFLLGKTEVLAPGAQASTDGTARSPQQAAKKEEYKSQQKLKLKEWNKKIRQKKKHEERGPSFTYPGPVRESLDFFSANGFSLEDLNMPALMNARKLLSRVFHPDKGGTHAEILELSAHFEVLESYLKS